MSALYSRISSLVPAPSSLPLVSRLTRLQDMLSRSHDLAADAGADVVDHSLEPLSHAALEIRAMERGLGPWSFMMSGYAVGLVLMAISFNRIANIVRPPPPSAIIERMARQRLRDARRAARGRDGSSSSSWRKSWRALRRRALSSGRQAITSPQALTVIRIPAIAALFSALIKLTLVLAQTSPVTPPDWAVHSRSYDTVLHSPTDTLLWSTFLCVCFALAVDAFIRGVNGSSYGSSFNLFGFSFLLHLYSSPLTHVGVPARDRSRLGNDHAGLATRPDWNVTFGIWLAVLELTWIQTSELSAKWGKRRLIPTGVCGVLGLVHFACTLLFNPARLPSFTFLTSLVSLGMLVVICLTVCLNALNQAFTLGEVTVDDLLPHASSRPTLIDDWSIALVRLASACLETSTVGGMGNEVASVRAPRLTYVDMSTRSRLSPASTAGYSVTVHELGRSPPAGFAHHIQDLRTQTADPQLARGGISIFPQRPRSDWANDTPYWREMKKFGRALSTWLGGALWWALGVVPGGRFVWRLGTRSGDWLARVRLGRRGFRLAPEIVSAEIEHHDVQIASSWSPRAGGEEAEGLYARFLQGEDDDDQAEEDDPTFDLSSQRRRARSYSVSSCSTSSSDDSDRLEDGEGEDGEEEDEPPLDPLATFSDLPPSPSLPPVLLAHMTSTSPLPLTRSRYQGLIGHSSTEEDLETTILQRRASHSGPRPPPVHSAYDDAAEDDDGEGSVGPCVVCYSNRREILLLPCLCLALCAECRAHMAVKTSAKEHACPCCRSKVTGYSRIYIP